MAHNVSIASHKANPTAMNVSFRLAGAKFGPNSSVNLEQALKNNRPSVAFTHALRCHPSVFGQLNAPGLRRHCICERRDRIFSGPIFLTAKDNSIHVAAANSYNRRGAGLTLQGGQTECFLHSGMDEQVGGPIEPRELL